MNSYGCGPWSDQAEVECLDVLQQEEDARELQQEEDARKFAQKVEHFLDEPMPKTSRRARLQLLSSKKIQRLQLHHLAVQSSV